jgi:hypothetical protein
MTSTTTTAKTISDTATDRPRVRFEVRIERDPCHPAMRIVFVQGCPHRVSLADGQDTPLGTFIGFAVMEHRLFCQIRSSVPFEAKAT